MKRRYSIFFVAFLTLLGLLGGMLCACSKTNRLEVLHYKKTVMNTRADKDRFFGKSAESPLLPVQRLNFRGLSYFPPDISYKLEAVFTPLKSSQDFKIQTSSGRERVYITKGRLDFSYGNQKFTLMAYQEKDQTASYPDELFVPFTDTTNGKQTYGGGRYLDINSPGQGKRVVVLDFNLAFNPYCAYNHNYSCPIPPKENHLSIPIMAGEKIFSKN